MVCKYHSQYYVAYAANEMRSVLLEKHTHVWAFETFKIFGQFIKSAISTCEIRIASRHLMENSFIALAYCTAQACIHSRCSSTVHNLICSQRFSFNASVEINFGIKVKCFGFIMISNMNINICTIHLNAIIYLDMYTCNLIESSEAKGFYTSNCLLFVCVTAHYSSTLVANGSHLYSSV